MFGFTGTGNTHGCELPCCGRKKPGSPAEAVGASNC